MKAPVAHDGYGRVALRLMGWGAGLAAICLLPVALMTFSMGHCHPKPDRAQLDVANLRNALTAYRKMTGAWPLEASWSEALLKKGILEREPLDPWDHPYLYRLEVADGGEFVPRVTSMGPDGVAETEDDLLSLTSLPR